MPGQLRITELAPETLAELMRRVHRDFPDDTLQKMADAGLPVNGDGTVNLIEYTAWLLKEVNSYGSESVAAQAD